MSQAATREFSILVENRFGVLFTITGLFCARGYNIEMLTVRPEGRTGLSRIKLTVQCSNARCDQIVKQLNKVLDVVDVEVITLPMEESWQTFTTNNTVRAV